MLHLCIGKILFFYLEKHSQNSAENFWTSEYNNFHHLSSHQHLQIIAPAIMIMTAMIKTINEDGKQHSSIIPSPNAIITGPHAHLLLLTPSLPILVGYSYYIQLWYKCDWLIRLNNKQNSARFCDFNCVFISKTVADTQTVVCI